MKHGIRVDTVTERKGFFGPRSVVKHRTITLTGKEYRRTLREKRGAAAATEAERLAALYMIWEEELAEAYGEERI